jgi:large subunit ribosomal protein L10
MLNRKQKGKLVEELTENFSQAKAVVFSNPQKLKVNQMQNLRKDLRSENIHCKVAKKKLFALALEKAGLKDVDLSSHKCSIATVFGNDDEISPAKIVHKFSKENKGLQILGGILNGKFLDDKGIIGLALLPSKDELLAKFVGSINSPVSGFVSVLNGNLRGLVCALNAIKDGKK